jgi:hypothetical protein
LYYADTAQERKASPEKQLRSGGKSIVACADEGWRLGPEAADLLQAVPDRNASFSFHGDRLDKLASEGLAPARHESDYLSFQLWSQLHLSIPTSLLYN